MKKHIISIVVILGCACWFSLPAYSEDLSSFAGKWTVQKTNDDGQRYTQDLEVKKDKFNFKLSTPDGETRLYAEGDIKVDKSGPFKTVVLSNIKAGGSSNDTSPIEDTYVSIYKFGEDDTLLLVMNFDKDRDEQQQKPRLDVYKKVKAAQK